MNKELEIYGTLGPSCASRTVLQKMFAEGISGMRLNLSHTTLADSEVIIDAFHQAAALEGVSPSLLIDMQGPELRIGKFPAPMPIENGETVHLVSGTEGLPSQTAPVIVIPAVLLDALTAGVTLLIDDGKITLETTRIWREGPSVSAEAVVRTGGVLQSRKSIAAVGLSVRTDVLTAQDRINLRQAASMGVTDVMQPFVTGAEDLIAVRQAMKEEGAGALRLFAKIENRAGAQALTQIIPHADMVVIARGDLGNSLPAYKLPVLQHSIAQICCRQNVPFMVVTQMLSSMEHSPVPTRAEVSDIYRAVAEGAGAVMVTGETASGEYPIEVSRILVRTAMEAYKAVHTNMDETDRIKGLF